MSDMSEHERLARELATHLLDGASGEDGVSYDMVTGLVIVEYPAAPGVIEAAIPNRWEANPPPDPRWRHAAPSTTVTFEALAAAEASGWGAWVQAFLGGLFATAERVGGPMVGTVQERSDGVRVRLDGRFYVAAA